MKGLAEAELTEWVDKAGLTLVEPPVPSKPGTKKTKKQGKRPIREGLEDEESKAKKTKGNMPVLDTKPISEYFPVKTEGSQMMKINDLRTSKEKGKSGNETNNRGDRSHLPQSIPLGGRTGTPEIISFLPRLQYITA